MARSKSVRTEPVKAVSGEAAPNPVWFKPVMLGFMLLGLLWIIVFYISGSVWPIESLGQWNILVGFGIMLIGFLMTTRWRCSPPPPTLPPPPTPHAHSHPHPPPRPPAPDPRGPPAPHARPPRRPPHPPAGPSNNYTGVILPMWKVLWITSGLAKTQWPDRENEVSQAQHDQHEREPRHQPGL